MTAKTVLLSKIETIRRIARAWAERINQWDHTWTKVRLPLLSLGIIGLILAYIHFPHQGPDLAASRYETLMLAVQSTNTATTALKAFTNLQYLNTSYEDPGIHWLTGLSIAGIKLFKPGFKASERLVYPIQFGIFIVALVLLSLRAIPLGISLGGIAALFAALQCRILYWSWDVYWAPALAVLATMAFFLSVTGWPRSSWWSWIAAALFGAFAGMMGLIRQDAGLIVQAAAFAFIFILLFYSLPRKRTNPAVRLHLPPAALVLCFIMAMFLPRLILSAQIHLVNRIAPASPVVGALEHGKWHALYLGLGFNEPPYAPPSNPYGIAWDDSVGGLHAVEQDPAAHFDTPSYMPTLRTLFMKVVADDPMFYLKTLISRTYYDLSLLADLAILRAGGPAYLMVLWPLLLLTPFFRSGERAGDGLIFGILAFAALIPPVLTFPLPVYSLGLGMAVMASPIFFLGGLFPSVPNRAFFPKFQTRRLILLLTLFILLGTSALACAAIVTQMSNDRFSWNLMTDSRTLLASVESDPWRTDRHFNHSLSAAQRRIAAAKVRAVAERFRRVPLASVQLSSDAYLRVLNVTRLTRQIVLFVESRRELDYGVFLLQPEGRNQVFCRKVLGWSPSQTYMLIFNTGPTDSQFKSFNLLFALDPANPSIETSTPVASIIIPSQSFKGLAP